jgi:hypothetical protein
VAQSKTSMLTSDVLRLCLRDRPVGEPRPLSPAF